MKQRLLSAALLAVFFIGAFHVVFPLKHAYAGIVDSVCGSATTPPCGPQHFKLLMNKLFLLFASVGTALLFVFMMGQIISSTYLYMFKGDAGALARARARSLNMLIGYGIIIAVFGGLYLAALKIFGVDGKYLQILQLFSEGFVQHAYAQETLTNPLSSDNAYDIILAGLSLVMKFFIYPSLIVMWVASGFKLVYSQGNPEGLKTARKWFLVSFIVTAIAFTLQGFILAFRETALKVFQNGTTQTVPQNPSSGAGATTQPAGTAPYSVQRVTDCTGQPKNKVCTTAGRDGLCGYNQEGSYACNVGACPGQVGLDGICYAGGTR